MALTTKTTEELTNTNLFLQNAASIVQEAREEQSTQDHPTPKIHDKNMPQTQYFNMILCPGY